MSSELGAGRVPSATVTRAGPRRSGGRVLTALLWGGLGFIAGAVFWHLVGFWSFVTEVVLDRTAAQATVVAPPSRLNAIPTVVLVEADRCTTLALDRRRNRTIAAPCTNDGMALRLVPDPGARDDLAALEHPHLQPTGYRPD